MGRSIFCVINPAAGHRATRRWKRFAARLQSQGLVFEQAFTARPGDACDLARTAAGNHDVVVVAGGDGTVFEAINGILESGSTGAVLGIVPFGTGNDVARAAGIRNPVGAFEALAAGQVRAVDLIKVSCQANGQPMVRHAMLFASVGITTELLQHTTPFLKRVCGQRFAYIAGLLFALGRYSTPMMKITCDGQSVKNRFVFACTSNGETFGGGMKIAPGALLDDGKLNVNLIEAIGAWEALSHLPKLLQGRHTSHPKVLYRTATEVSIETETPIEVAADGDVIGFTPARFQVVPRALRLVVP